MWIIRKSYAKINLFLEIIDRLPNGYHRLWTLFQMVNIFDTLKARVLLDHSNIKLKVNHTITDNIQDNLVYQAAVILQEHCKISQGIEFELEKTIPTQAGLGGGSSNAATALLLCCELWNIDLPKEELQKIACQLGADVSFFLDKSTAIGEGIGGELSFAPSPYPFYVVIATPKSYASTYKMYQNLQISKKMKYVSFKENYQKNHQDPSFYSFCHNDFEKVAFKNDPLILDLFSTVKSYNPVHTMLCGSGASICGLFNNLENAENLVKSIKKKCRFVALTDFKINFS